MMAGLSRIRPYLAVLSLLGAVAGCSNHEEKPAAVPPVLTGVAIETVRGEPVHDVTEASGTVRARNTAVIAARVPGAVRELHAREGDRVTKGTLLLTLESAEGTAGAAGARAAVEEARQAVAQAEARTRLADATFARYQRLMDEQAVTRQEYEGKQMEQDVARQELARARSRLVQARETSRSAATTAGYSRIAAPVTGTVTSRAVEVGMTVFPGTQLVTIEEGSGYRLEVSVPEALLGRIRQGDQVEVMVDGAAPWAAARISEVVPAVEPASRSFTVKIDLPGDGFRSGMYGRAFFRAGTREGFLVPKTALVERGALSMVWVAGRDNAVRMRLVKPGRVVGDRIEILSGLSAGDRVVAGGGERLVDGARVAP